MSSHLQRDELSAIVESIREYCARKELKVFPGWVSGEKTPKVRWTIVQRHDWRAFVDIAAALSVQIVYLDASRFELGHIEDAKDSLVGDGDCELALEELKAKVGQTSWFEVGFFLGSVYHSYTQTAEWYDSFSDLTEKLHGIPIPEEVEADPKLINRWGETLAKHERFPGCRNWSQRMYLLMDIARDEFEQLRPGQGIRKAIEKAEAYYFIKIQPQIDEKLRMEAETLREQGKTLTEIARRLGVSRDKIRALKKQDQ